MPKAIAGWYGQLFFKAPTGAGWSEGYYLNASFTDPASATTQLAAVATARRGLLSTVFVQESQRLSRLDLLRDVSSVSPFASLNGSFAPTGGPYDFTHPGLALLIRSLAIGGYAANRMIHAVPEAVVLNGMYSVNTGVEPGAAWQTALDNYFAALTANTRGVFYERPTPPNPIPDPRPIVTGAWAAHAPQRIVTRQVGRPFGLSRGRSV